MGYSIKISARDAVFEKNDTGMVVLDPDFNIIDYNSAAKRLLNLMGIQIGHYSIEEVLKEEPRLLKYFKSQSEKEFSFTVGEEEYCYQINSLPLGKSKNMKLLKTIRDITERKIYQEQLLVLATTDSLSGLNNRREFKNLFRREYERAKRYDEELSMLIMDFDQFKSINDSYGHGAGDAAIQKIGTLIKDNFRKTDIRGRIGGEEFAVVLQKTSLDQAKAIGEDFRKIIEKTRLMYDGNEISFTVSIGVTSIKGCNNNSILDLMKYADKALYAAKARGKNCLVAFEER